MHKYWSYGEFMFLTPNARKAFNWLRKAFIKAPILWHFDPDCHIWIETDASDYAIGGVLSQLTSNQTAPAIVSNLAKFEFSASESNKSKILAKI